MMKSMPWIRALFAIAAVYDFLLGLLFAVAPGWAYRTAEVTEPNHWGYVQFPAALLIVFGLMFLAIACNPARNRNLIPYGIGLKLAYCIVVFGHWLTLGIPDMWKPFAIIDIIMAILFAWAYFALKESRPASA